MDALPRAIMRTEDRRVHEIHCKAGLGNKAMPLEHWKGWISSGKSSDEAVFECLNGMLGFVGSVLGRWNVLDGDTRDMLVAPRLQKKRAFVVKAQDINSEIFGSEEGDSSFVGSETLFLRAISEQLNMDAVGPNEYKGMLGPVTCNDGQGTCEISV